MIYPVTGQHPIDRSSPVPTYQQIASDISKRIAQHEWYIDEKLPSEMELAKTYGVSRVTLRQAMAQLKKDGSSKNSRARVHLSRAIRGVSCRTWHSLPGPEQSNPQPPVQPNLPRGGDHLPNLGGAQQAGSAGGHAVNSL